MFFLESNCPFQLEVALTEYNCTCSSFCLYLRLTHNVFGMCHFVLLNFIYLI